MGEKALELLAPLVRHPHVGDVRGRGLMLGIELVAEKATRRPFPRSEKRAEAVGARAFESGLVTYPGGGCATGTDGDGVMIAPPFVVTEAEREERWHPDDAQPAGLDLLPRSPRWPDYPSKTPCWSPRRAIVERDPA
jgi:acetylornithine/succinyldiaminopimelate/putrescine aminotransferase